MRLTHDILDTYIHKNIVNVPIHMDDECIYGIYAKMDFYVPRQYVTEATKYVQ